LLKLATNKCVRGAATTLPNYKVVGRGLLRKILRDAELSVEEFMKLM
jgi:hypothetical protein